jgi:hypothetical protein
MQILKINTKSQIQNWYDFILQTLIFIPLYIYLLIRDGYNNAFIVIYVFLFIQFSFTIYLHIKYFLKNKNEEYIIHSDRIIRIKKSKESIFNSSDIKKIVICKSANMDKWGIPYTTFESFRVARIYLNDGTGFILTNLLAYDLEKPLRALQGVKFERRKGFSFFI